MNVELRIRNTRGVFQRIEAGFCRLGVVAERRDLEEREPRRRISGVVCHFAKELLGPAKLAGLFQRSREIANERDTFGTTACQSGRKPEELCRIPHVPGRERGTTGVANRVEVDRDLGRCYLR